MQQFKIQDTNVSAVFKTFFADSELAKLFFSKANIDTLQQLIRSVVFENTTYTIDRQSDTELLVIMKSLFLQYAKHPPPLIRETGKMYTAELYRLNDIVIKDVVPRIVSELSARLAYLHDIQNPIREFPKTISTTIKGEREYRSPTQVWTGGNL